MTRTGPVGELDIELATGARLTGVEVSAVRAIFPIPTPSNGCSLAGLAGLGVGMASVAAAAITVWARARWGA